MGRSRISARAMRSLRKGSDDVGEALGDARKGFEKNVKRTRSDFDDVRDEAVVRGRKLVDEAVKHGTELLDMISSKGLGAAGDWAQAIGKPKRGFPWGKLLAVAAIAGVGAMIYNKD